MYAIAIGRVLRMLRIRRDLRQSDVGAKARISKSVVGRHENGRIGSIAALERHAGVFGLRIDVRLAGRAGELTRLADEEHSRIVEIIAAWFRSAGFLIETEASFSEWGERGRVDLLAFDPSTGTLVIVEVKTQFLDLQDLFGSINVKERLAATVAERRGWRIQRRVTVLAAADTTANRKVVREHSTLFAAFVPRRLTLAAVRGGPDRLLIWVAAESAARTSWLAGRQRVRPRRNG